MFVSCFPSLRYRSILRSFLRTKLICVFTLLLTSCSIPPLVQDFSGNTTRDIVKKIRCEARDALVDRLFELIESSTDPLDKALYARLSSDPESKRPDKLAQLKEHEMSCEIYTRINRFRESTMSLLFEFTITEDNSLVGNSSFRMPFTRGTLTVKLGDTGIVKKRTTVRKFETVDVFDNMIRGKNADDEDSPVYQNCDLIRTSYKNIIYPITGKIGMKETLYSFVNISRDSGNLDEFKDDLTFTTKIGASTTPSVKLDDVSNIREFRLSTADLTPAGVRTDQHRVTIFFDERPRLEEFKPLKRVHWLGASRQAVPEDLHTPRCHPEADRRGKKCWVNYGLTYSIAKAPKFESVDECVARRRAAGLSRFRTAGRNVFRLNKDKSLKAARSGLRKFRRILRIDTRYLP